MKADPEIRSLWQATAVPAPDCPPLAGERRIDVAVIGGGFTGLSAALHLAEAGAKVAVLEAREPGWGASGRNGGMVIPGLKEDPDDLVARHGPEAGEAMVRASAATADLVFGLIERHSIDCDARRAGWIQPAHTAAALPALRRRYEQWAGRGADVAWLSREEIAARLGSDRYHGGWIDRRGGGLQPLSYARGLARAAQAAGAAVHGQSPVTALGREG
ncbi:MAG TPA: FAD-dependent oxidoreductase, partial [Alphaproteobacteria bacterium]|nr:FAD-dependent oxidoreductase [Alphaproteobacteria bacterium]